MQKHSELTARQPKPKLLYEVRNGSWDQQTYDNCDFDWIIVGIEEGVEYSYQNKEPLIMGFNGNRGVVDYFADWLNGGDGHDP